MTRGARLGFDERRGQRRLAWAIAVVFVAGLLSFIAKGADEPADPYFLPTSTTVAPPGTVPAIARTGVPGFGEVAFHIGSGPKLCALLAQTVAQQNRGLMGRTDLAGHAGMVFVFPADTTETFYMRNTPMPLSIAWFDSAGHFVSSTDMAPCADRPNCPTYAAARAYRYALEVQQGGLSGLGAGPGSTITVAGSC